jgi:hypothetical protein
MPFSKLNIGVWRTAELALSVQPINGTKKYD